MEVDGMMEVDDTIDVDGAIGVIRGPCISGQEHCLLRHDPARI